LYGSCLGSSTSSKLEQEPNATTIDANINGFFKNRKFIL
jgi:hypothetical protein